MPPTTVSAPDLTAITVFLASTATPERSGLPYLDAVLPAEDRRGFDRRMERGRQHFFGPPSGAHASADDDHVEGDHHREHEQRDLNPLGEAVAMLTPLRSG